MEMSGQFPFKQNTRTVINITCQTEMFIEYNRRQLSKLEPWRWGVASHSMESGRVFHDSWFSEPYETCSL